MMSAHLFSGTGRSGANNRSRGRRCQDKNGDVTAADLNWPFTSEIGRVTNKPSIAGTHDIVMAYLGAEG